ncbi:UNVERIFIED_CONTAM: hypothetical protein HDU68_002320 [Siphonaria sp. JEL0065]|nr:hypothetical protein HDU68_002320 [Siphonaria sp. JEL0065]
MLKFFFDISGAAENRPLFSELRIERQHPEVFHEGGAFGRHPVINLDLRLLKALSWHAMLSKIRTLLSNTYSQFDYLLESTALKTYEKTLFNLIMSGEETVDEANLMSSLQKLSGFLTRCHNSPCVILIDEYDVPLEVAYHKGFFEDASVFFSGMFSALLKNSCLSLMSRGSVPITISDSLGYSNKLDSVFTDLNVWTLLYYAGYLNYRDGYASIPNNEVYSEWVTWLLPKIGEQAVMTSFVDLLLIGNVEAFSSSLPKTIMESLLYFDVEGSTSGKKAEAFYHAFCLGLFITARNRKYEVKSNHEGGTGRYDIKIMPTTQISTSIGVIVEFKVAGEEDDVQDMALTGLNQVSDKEYRAAYPPQLTRLCQYGIAFKGKNCLVIGENWQKVDNLWQKFNK